MKKFFIKNHTDNGGVFIFHALLDYSYTNIQWHIADNQEEAGTPLEKERYESFIISTEKIRENGYEGKWVYCTCDHNEEKIITEKVQLHSDYQKLNRNDFDEISVFDENGMIKEMVND